MSYAEPKQSEMNQDQVKSVYVGGLQPGATEESLKTFFQSLENLGEARGSSHPATGCFAMICSVVVCCVSA